jgi:hypothetical protein
MRKFLWCCAAAAATVCAALWTVACVARRPGTSVHRASARAVEVAAAPGNAAHPDEPEDFVPPDPVPLVGAAAAACVPSVPADPSPAIVIHDEEDLNPDAGRAACKAETTLATTTPAPSTIDLTGLPASPAEEVGQSPPRMPRCADAPPVPRMPHADEDGGACNPPDPQVFAFWVGFFSGPQPAGGDACREDEHYARHYPGCPHVGGPDAAGDAAPRPSAAAPPAFPGAAEESEPPAPALRKRLRPHSSRVDFGGDDPLLEQLPQPKCDTMEMRPSDWKPYSLDPGPF